MAYFLCVIGMVLIIEGLPYLAFPHKVKVLARQIEAIPNRTLQVIGLVAAFTGLAIVYLGRQLGGM